jgi:hypothetical protein
VGNRFQILISKPHSGFLPQGQEEGLLLKPSKMLRVFVPKEIVMMYRRNQSEDIIPIRLDAEKHLKNL